MKKNRGSTGRILEHLKTGQTITTYESFERFGVTRLSGVIFCLRKQGHNIESIPQVGKNRYGEKVRFVQYKLK